jgi:hypothetical protein
MNQNFYETRSKEKIKELMEEGMRNQELHRLKGAKGGFLSNPSKLAVTLLGILILLGLLIR